MSPDELFTVCDGLAVIGPRVVHIVSLLKACFKCWEREWSAAPMRFAGLLHMRDLERIDYFRNFPHLGLITAQMDDESQARCANGSLQISREPLTGLESSGFALPSAACYSVYLHYSDCQIDTPLTVATEASCFRNEVYFRGLERLRCFTMYEVVAIGTMAHAKWHYERAKERTIGFVTHLGLPVGVQFATDPFFDQDGDRARMQALFPVKEEFVGHDSIALGSVNFHRNFFGERCAIRLTDGSPAFTSCIGFGLERWILALLKHFKNDCGSIETALMSYRADFTPSSDE